MADSIEEQIVQNIITTLEGITVANGYANTVKLVTDDLEAGIDLHLFPAIFVAVGSEIPERGATSVTRREMNVMLEYWIRVQKDPRKAVASIRADIQKRMMVDSRRGGLAVDTLEGPSSYGLVQGKIPEGMGQTGYIIQYRTKTEDPFSTV